MYQCEPCDRRFNDYHRYQMHIDNSAAHRIYQYECEACEREFSNEYSLHQHCSSAAGHPYCIPCKRMFMNQNNLMQNWHQHSRLHTRTGIQCPFCQGSFATASGVTIHLESGTCSNSNLDRHKINHMVQRMDRNSVITRPMLTMPGYNNIQTIATERAWNGQAYECYLCPREFASLRALNSHMSSPVHEQNMYRCPGRGCGRTCGLLSALIQHVESESCGLMRFAQVQQQVRSGVESFVGKMITN